MRFSKDLKVEKCASTDKTRSRYALQHVRLEVGPDGTGKLISCNGRALAVVEVETDPEDTTGPVPVAAIVEARKGHADGVASAYVAIQSSFSFPIGFLTWCRSSGRSPTEGRRPSNIASVPNTWMNVDRTSHPGRGTGLVQWSSVNSLQKSWRSVHTSRSASTVRC